jgi:hypothetical protein
MVSGGHVPPKWGAPWRQFTIASKTTSNSKPSTLETNHERGASNLLI